MRKIVIIFYSILVFGSVFAMSKAPAWLEKNWFWALGLYLLALCIMYREHQKTQKMQHLLIRCARLEMAMLELLRMHCNKDTFDSFLDEGFKTRLDSPNANEISKARIKLDQFENSIATYLFLDKL